MAVIAHVVVVDAGEAVLADRAHGQAGALGLERREGGAVLDALASEVPHNILTGLVVLPQPTPIGVKE